MNITQKLFKNSETYLTLGLVLIDKAHFWSMLKSIVDINNIVLGY